MLPCCPHVNILRNERPGSDLCFCHSVLDSRDGRGDTHFAHNGALGLAGVGQRFMILYLCLLLGIP